MAEITSRPERLLWWWTTLTTWTPCRERDERLCGDGAEEQPACILMPSLLREVLLLGSSLMATITHVGMEKLKSLVQCPVT